MKTLKLEVGKSYRNRRGEEVKIVSKNNAFNYPYHGSSGEWYTESGRWDCHSDDPENLITEVPEALTGRYYFTIPDGVKELTIEQEGNRIVVELVPEDKAPAPGDVMVNKYDSVYIFKEVFGSAAYKYYARLEKDGRLTYNRLAMSGRPATPEEAQPLCDALKKAGKRWNAETMQVEDVPEADRIREWAMKRYSNYEGIAEAIESYLKHKEGEK